MPNKKRLINGFLANGFGQGVTVLIQLLSIPILISIWGMDKYGEWVVIYSLPFYLALSDFGFTIAAGSMISVQSTSDRKKMLAVYQTSWVVVTSVSISFLVIAIASAWLFDVKGFLSISSISTNDLGIVFSVLFVYVGFCLQTGIILVAYRGLRRNPTGVFLDHLLRLFEWLVAMGGVVLFEGGFLTVAISFLATRFVGNILLLGHLKFIIRSDLTLGVKSFDYMLMRQLIKPSFSALGFPFGLALSLQGVLVVISHSLGPSYVSIYSIFRTLSRVVIQAVAMLNHALLPEISYMYGKASSRKKIPRVIKKNQLYSILASTSLCFVLYVLNDDIIRLWVSKDMGDHSDLLLVLLLSSMIYAFSQPLWLAQMAANVHMVFASLFFITSLMIVISSSFLIDYIGLLGVGYSVLFGELILLFFAWVTFKRYLYSKCV